MVLTAVRDKIVADAKCVADLGRFRFEGTTEDPCVFTVDPAPREAPAPVCVLTQTGGTDEGILASTRGTDPLEVRINITVWEEKNRTDKRLRRLAWSIHNLFFGKGKSLTVSGWSFVKMNVSAPQHTRDVDGFPGYAIDLVVVVEKERR